MDAKTIALRLGLAAASVAAAFALSRLPAFQYFDLQLRRNEPVDLLLKTAIVSIQYPTLESEPSVGGTVSRARVAELLTRLKADGARAILLDLMFTEETPQDSVLSRAIEDMAPVPVILNAQSTKDVKGEEGHVPNCQFRYPTCLPLVTPKHVQISCPILWEPDATVRGAPLIMANSDAEGEYMANAAFATWLAISGASIGDLKWDEGQSGWTYRDHLWQVDRFGNFETAWLKPGAVPELEFTKVRSGKVDSDLLRDAVVIVSSRTDSSRANDVHATPVGARSGAEIIASLIQSLQAPRRPERSYFYGAVGSIIVALAFAALLLRPKLLTVLAALLVLVAAAWTTIPAGVSFTWIVGTGVVASSLALGGEGVWRTRFMNKALSKIFSTPALTKENFLATVVFVDMVDSTKIIQGRPPDEIAEMLSKILTIIVAEAKKHRAGVEGTMGDGAFLVFYSDSKSNHIHDALAAMRSIKRAMEVAGPDFEAKFNVRPSLTFGTAFGEITSRILKTKQHVGSSLYGTTIHLAARLQGECGKAGVEALASEEVAAVFPNLTTSIGERDLKGFGPTAAFALDLELPGEENRN